MLEHIATPPLRPAPHVADHRQGKSSSSSLDSRYLRIVNILRFALPALLFLISNGFELYEHWGEIVLDNAQLLGEILIFGLLGPVLVFVWLSYIGILMKKLALANRQLSAVNASLEQQVAERTATLALRNRELASANADLARKNKELRQLDQLKSDFVALVSHELRAPLATLNGAVEMTLHTQHALPDPARRLLEVVAAESKRLTCFVQTILDLSRLEAGMSGAADEEVDLVELVTGIADDARFEAEAHGRQVRFSGEGATTVKVRAELLHRAFENVIRNAVKYTHEGTTVEVRVKRRTAPDRLIVTVADRGPGVPESDLPAIFEPFFRGGSSAATAGFGLGLAIARRAIEARGGSIRALNHPGGGLQIEIVLPISERIIRFSAAGMIHVP